MEKKQKIVMKKLCHRKETKNSHEKIVICYN